MGSFALLVYSTLWGWDWEGVSVEVTMTWNGARNFKGHLEKRAGMVHLTMHDGQAKACLALL